MSKNVLVVEDDRPLASALERALAGEGYPARVVNDGASAIETLRKEPPGVVLLDLLLPKKDGRAVLDFIRSSESLAKLPVIVMTGVFKGSDHKRSLEKAGAQVFLEKPFKKSELMQHVRRYIGRAGPKHGRIDDAHGGEVFSLEEVAVPEILWNAMSTKASGALVFESGKRRKIVLLENGKATRIKSNVARECLGNRLLASGRIDARAVQESLKRSRAEGRKQGEILVEMGVVTEAEVEKALVEQCQEKLLELFGWVEGHAQLQEDTTDVDQASQLPDWSTAELVLRGCQFVGAQRLEKLLFPCWDEALVRGGYELASSEAELPAVAAFLAALKDGARVRDMAGDHAAAIYGMRLVGALVRSDASQGPTATRRSRADSGKEKELSELLERQKEMSHFEVLGVSEDAEPAQSRQAFLKLAKQFHPDRYRGGSKEVVDLAAGVFARITQAHEILADPESLRTYREALAKGGESDVNKVTRIVTAEVQFGKGEALFRKREYAAALEPLGWAIEINPDEGEFQVVYGWTYFLVHQGSPDAEKVAREHIERGVKLSPKSANGFYYFGMFRKACGDRVEAEKMFKWAVELQPSHKEASRELRLMNMRKDKGGFADSGGGLFGFGRKKG